MSAPPSSAPAASTRTVAPPSWSLLRAPRPRSCAPARGAALAPFSASPALRGEWPGRVRARRAATRVAAAAGPRPSRFANDPPSRIAVPAPAGKRLPRQRKPLIRGEALRLRQPQFFPHDLRAEHQPATILYCAWRRLVPSRPMPQSDEITSRSVGMCFSASRIMSATWSGRSILQCVVVDDADHDLLVLDDPRRRTLRGRRCRTSRSRRSAHRRRLRSRPPASAGSSACRGRCAAAPDCPLQVWHPHFGLRPEPLDRVVEDLDQVGDRRAGERLAACHRHHVDLRLLHLQRRAAGVGRRPMSSWFIASLNPQTRSTGSL